MNHIVTGTEKSNTTVEDVFAFMDITGYADESVADAPVFTPGVESTVELIAEEDWS